MRTDERSFALEEVVSESLKKFYNDNEDVYLTNRNKHDLKLHLKSHLGVGGDTAEEVRRNARKRIEGVDIKKIVTSRYGQRTF